MAVVDSATASTPTRDPPSSKASGGRRLPVGPRRSLWRSTRCAVQSSPGRHCSQAPSVQVMSKLELSFWSSDFFITSDRKSTRLNSSHVKISYAVFCLKKKIHQLQRVHLWQF